MFFIVLESTTPISRAAIAGEYYIQMQKLLHTQPGFISEDPYAFPIHEDQQVLIAKWTDETGVYIWRKQHDYLQIQYKARHGVFDAYRLRVGPDMASSEDQRSTSGRSTTSTVNVTDLIHPTKASVADAAAELVDASVYQGEKSVLWISSWSTEMAAAGFECSLRRTARDTVHVFRVKRDHGGIERSEAPTVADAVQATTVVEEGKGASS
ncbi:MAG: hypothetical protein Q9166_002877 [cf. Caloplaca sp. 2 TL-2023]